LHFKENNIHKIFVCMMGVTNHWVSFMAHKYNGDVEFWYFDSSNDDFLEMNDEEIQALVRK